ncbi:MAG TPA: hypothetical protein VEB86_07780, partial [Chryseosolibacter sp.]|nr:hypothetical protein [Chryseosolibacter sp.]
MYRILLFVLLSLAVISCEDDARSQEYCSGFEPGVVIFGVTSSFSVGEIAQLTQENNLHIDHIDGAVYESELPADQVDFMVDHLNTKPYINNGGFRAVKGGSVYADHVAGTVRVVCRLSDLTKENYEDWVATLNLLKLHEQHSEYKS